MGKYSNIRTYLIRRICTVLHQELLTIPLLTNLSSVTLDDKWSPVLLRDHNIGFRQGPAGQGAAPHCSNWPKERQKKKILRRMRSGRGPSCRQSPVVVVAVNTAHHKLQSQQPRDCEHSHCTGRRTELFLCFPWDIKVWHTVDTLPLPASGSHIARSF